MSAIQPPAEPIRVRASGSAYLVFSLLCALPLGVAVAAPLIGRAIVWEAVAVATLGWVFAIVWLTAFRLELTPSTLVYRSLFGGRRTVALEAIGAAELEVGVLRPGDRFKPLYRLVITPRAPASWPPIVVNLKVLAMPELKRVVAALGVTSAAPTAGDEPA